MNQNKPAPGLGPRWQQYLDGQSGRYAGPNLLRRTWRDRWQDWQERRQRRRELEDLGIKFYLWAQKADIPPSGSNDRHGWELESKDLGMVGDWHQSFSVLYVNRSGVLRELSDGGNQKADCDPEHVRRLMIQQWGAELD